MSPSRVRGAYECRKKRRREERAMRRAWRTCSSGKVVTMRKVATAVTESQFSRGEKVRLAVAALGLTMLLVIGLLLS